MRPEFRRDPGRRTRAARALNVSVAALLTLSCHTAGPRVPWAAPGPAVSFEHADVRTLNHDYRRTEARVLLREVSVPTRAALDYAAYHANFIIADPPPEDAPQAAEGTDHRHEEPVRRGHRGEYAERRRAWHPAE